MRTSQAARRTLLAVVVLLTAAPTACTEEPDPGPGGTYTFIYAGPPEQLGALRVDVIVLSTTPARCPRNSSPSPRASRG